MHFDRRVIDLPPFPNTLTGKNTLICLRGADIEIVIGIRYKENAHWNNHGFCIGLKLLRIHFSLRCIAIFVRPYALSMADLGRAIRSARARSPTSQRSATRRRDPVCLSARRSMQRSALTTGRPPCGVRSEFRRAAQRTLCEVIPSLMNGNLAGHSGLLGVSVRQSDRPRRLAYDVRKQREPGTFLLRLS